MYKMKIDFLNARQLKKGTKESIKSYRYYAKKAMGEYMILIKRESIKEIRPNPKKLGYRDLPSLPDKLTFRTGKMRRGLAEGKSIENDLDTYWPKLENVQTNTNRNKLKTLNGIIRMEKTGQIKAWWSPFVRDGSAALGYTARDLFYKINAKSEELQEAYGLDASTAREAAEKLVNESGLSRGKQDKKHVAFRYMWEHRGRPYMAPAHNKNKMKWSNIAEKHLRVWANKFGKLDQKGG